VAVVPGPDSASLTGSGARAIDVLDGVSDVVIRDLDLSGADVDGGAIRIGAGASVALENALIARSTASRGGAVFVGAGALLDAEVVELSLNQAQEGGAVFLDAGAALSLTFATLEGNAALRSGGALVLGGGSTFLGEDAQFVSNLAWEAGGAVVSSAPDFVECVRCRFQGNSCGTSGGAWSAEGGTVTLIDVVASTNSATVGGALHVGGGADVMLEGGAFTSHTAIDGGSVLDVVFGAVFFDAVDLATPGPDDNASPEVRVPGTTYDLDGTWSGVCDELECA
jgi:hypothetical protein